MSFPDTEGAPGKNFGSVCVSSKSGNVYVDHYSRREMSLIVLSSKLRELARVPVADSKPHLLSHLLLILPALRM